MPPKMTLIRLPIHLKWSGPREYDLSDPRQRRRVYEIVLREGQATDIRNYIDPDELLPVWDDLVLPQGVRAAWEDYFDYCLKEPEQSPIGPVLSSEELAADKLLALFGRAEARDFVDVFFLAQKFGINAMLAWAKEKDPGFDPYVLAKMIGQIDRHPRPEFEVDDPTYPSLLEFFRNLRASLIEQSLGQ